MIDPVGTELEALMQITKYLAGIEEWLALLCIIAVLYIIAKMIGIIE